MRMTAWRVEVGVFNGEDYVVALRAGVDVGVLAIVRGESVIAEEGDTEEKFGTAWHD